ncbi:hypothetical protein P691DRAFT_501972 [Macrolepiota fuliginosa MF-IS2]|uniref:Uncharacterized protein n=1 Tax=Macrolepiota fuliginosa MF-IS2 TaxID=1400762 RepID=A0A9P6C3G6_9AGAR|nr:hypothetical protein P691DRAFT_501972 [Macrolepiota fuliginosa MF-IS2]
MQNLLFQARNGIFGLTIILALAVLGLSAHWSQLTVEAGFFVDFEGIGLAASVLTIFALSIFLVVGIVRKNAMITIIGVELPTLVILSGLFLAEGIVTSGLGQETWPEGCDSFFLNSVQMQICRQFMALKGISFAIFGIRAEHFRSECSGSYILTSDSGPSKYLFRWNYGRNRLEGSLWRIWV